MRRIVFLLMVTIGIASPARSATRLSVADLEQLLAAARGQSDRKIAKQLTNLELTERASSARLARWETEFPGHHCHEALTELADASAFLNLPAADMPANAPPDRDAQMDMLARTAAYVTTTISRLPNFYATRTTQHFEDTPPQATFEHGNSAPTGRGGRLGSIPTVVAGQSSYEPIHFIGTSNFTVSYRDGFELRGSKKIDFSNMVPTEQGLNTAGEFGPVLSVVLQDAMRSQMIWDHWEQDATWIAAVFRYAVPSGQSSYVVAIPRGKMIDKEYPAYHGEIAIDPSDGAILRITVMADLAPPNELVKSSIVVEYGSIPIGGANYICPVKSVALSRTPLFISESGVQSNSSLVQTQLNDVAFTDYHLFRAEARVLAGDSVSNQETPPPRQ